MYGLVGKKDVIHSILYNEPTGYFYLTDSVENPGIRGSQDFSKHFIEDDTILVPLELVK